MVELVPHSQLPLRRQLRHPGRGSRSAGAAVDRFFPIKHGVTGMRPRHRRLARPQDMAQAPDRRMFGMHELILRIQRRPQLRRPPHQFPRRVIRHVAERLLRLHNRVEVAAIGHVHHDLAQTFNFRRKPFCIKETRHIGQPHFLDKPAVLYIRNLDAPSRSIHRQPPRFARGDQPILQPHRHRPDQPMPAHRQTA